MRFKIIDFYFYSLCIIIPLLFLGILTELEFSIIAIFLISILIIDLCINIIKHRINRYFEKREYDLIRTIKDIIESELKRKGLVK